MDNEPKPSHKRKNITDKEQGAYTDEDRCKAVQAVVNGEMSTKDASKKYGPSVRTINRYAK